MQTILTKRFFWPVLAISFLIFIFWIIILADLGRSSYVTQYVRHLPFNDKAGHLLLYGVLAFLVNLALTNRTIKLLNYRILLGAALVFAFAIGEELTQIALSTRNFELWDIVCDVVGILLFSKLALWVGAWLWQDGEHIS